MTDTYVTKLDYHGKEIILVSTAHVSKESIFIVRQTIEDEKPDSVCIELDEGRYHNIQNPKAWENTDIVKVIKSNRVGFLVISLALSSYQKKIAKQLGTTVGGEMLQGIESAKQVGANLVLADRDIQTTFLRIWRNLNLWEKTKLIVGVLFSFDNDNEVSEQDLKELMQSDMLESVMSGIKKKFPKVCKILIGERDQFLASKIKNAPGSKVVAVLGGAHVPGIKNELFKEQDIAAISLVPPISKAAKAAGWIIPITIVAIIVYAFTENVQTGLQQLSTWAIWTGVLAAGFTALSLGHPLSILTSLIAAPLTTLHPLFACGLFTGLVEASLRKPTVQDVQNIPADIFSIKGFFRNKFLKTLLVVMLANVGASLGTFIAGTNLINNLL